ncbi:MAG: M48 family metallopeptidase [Planctomycetota bacterium]|nr:M48 family metallopeptidase [Planctomycetota bacterium]MDA1211370.1 M48 family metallopeptidase [Planctomycetota bacterium]
MFDSYESFQGGVFHASVPEGRAGASIYLTHSEIVAKTQPEGEQTFSIRLSECQLDLGGASGRMLFCRTPDRSLTIFCEEKGFAQALHQDAMGTLSEQLSNLCMTQRRSENQFRFWVMASAVLLVVLCVGGYYGVLAASRAAVHALPISVDEKIGTIAMQSMDLEEPLDEEHPANQLVAGIVDRLKPHAAIREMDFNVVVVESDEVNAFALPGGEIVVYTGLIEQAESAEQIAGVIAHEMSHATLRHGLQSVSQSLGIIAAIQIMIGDVGGLLALGSELAQESILTGYSRGAETEADLEGARMLHAAHIDPKSMAEFFELLKEQQGDIPGVIAWISTHPQHAQRIENIINYEKTLPKVEYHLLDLDLSAAQQALK